MSHDRKPGRVQVVQAESGSPKQRRGGGAAAATAARGKRSGRGQALLIMLYLLASIGTAVAIELLLPS